MLSVILNSVCLGRDDKHPFAVDLPSSSLASPSLQDCPSVSVETVLSP